MIQKFDFLIIGSGIAGMSYALKVAHKGKVALICKTELEEANTFFAQGGVASVTNTLVDNFEKHIEDTMIAGDWLSDRAAVEKVVREAPSQIKQLIEWGVEFDKNEKASSTCIAKAATPSSVSSTTRTTPVPRFRTASSRRSNSTPISPSSRNILPSKSSRSTTWG